MRVFCDPNPTRANQCKTQDDDITSLVGRENVAQGHVAYRVQQACHE
jgi:hypothetical protein